MKDTRTPKTYRNCTIDPVGIFGPRGTTYGRVSDPKHFTHKNRTQSRWWRVTTPDGKWVDCATVEDAKRAVDSPVGSMKEALR